MRKETSLPLSSASSASEFARWVPPVAAVAVLAISLVFERWEWARFPRMVPRFGDLQIITATATCIQNGDWTPSGPTCDPFGRPYNYPVIWAQAFAALNLNDSRVFAVGTVLGILLIAALAVPLVFLVRSGASWGRVAVSSLCVLSPPIALGLERGNTDGLILVLLVVSVLLHSQNRQLSAVLMGLVSGFKFFPALVMAAFLPKKRNVWPLMIFLSVMTAILVISSESLVRLAEMRDPTAEFRFGSLLLPFYAAPAVLNYPRLWVLLGGVALTLIPALVLWTAFANHVRVTSRTLATESFGSTLFLYGGLVFVGSFLSGSRGDYSQMFLVVTLLGLASSPTSGPAVFLLFGLGLLSLWGAFWIHPEFVFGDAVLMLFVWILVALLLEDRIGALKATFKAKSG